MTHSYLRKSASDRRSVRGSAPRMSRQHSVGTSRRRAVAVVLSPLLASAGMVGISSTADAATVIATGHTITAFPDRDMVEVDGYPAERLTIEVVRDGQVVGVTHGTGPTVEVNHGPLGDPLPGDCWEGPVPNITGGDIIRVSAPGMATDTMDVADVQLVGDPVRGTNSVSYSITSSVTPAVEFRGPKPDVFRPSVPVTGNAPSFNAVFTPLANTTDDTANDRNIPAAEQLNVAMTAAWRATVDASGGGETAMTLAESDGVNGPAAGCPSLAEQLPGAPGGVDAVAAASGGVTVTWDAPAQTGTTPISEYRIRVRQNTTNLPTVTGIAPSARSFTVGGLTPGTTYTFQVFAVNAAGQGPFSDPTTAAPTGPGNPPPGDTVAPTVGTLSGSLTGTTANLTWPAASDNVGVTGYQVFRNGAQVGANLAATARSFSQANLAAGTHNYTLKAVDAAGNVSAASNAVTLTVQASAVPGAPTGVTAARGNNSATVGWVAPTTGGAVTGYQVQVRTTAGVQVGALRAAAASARSLVVTGLTNTTAYTVRVRATSTAGPGAYSSAVNLPRAAVPGAPVIGTAAAGVTGGAITATANWTPPASTGGAAINGYIVRALRMSPTGTVLGTTTSAVQPAAARSFVMTLPQLGNYRFTVQARNSVGTGAQSARSNLVAGR